MGKLNILVEGGSGSGKSAVADELTKRGYSAINSDWLCYNGDPETGEPVEARMHDTWIWDLPKILELLNSSDPVTFICGGARNREKIIDRFDAVFELMIDEDTLRHRIVTRAEGNDWGKKPDELAKILELHRSGVDRPANAIEIDATKPLQDVVDEILEKIEEL